MTRPETTADALPVRPFVPLTDAELEDLLARLPAARVAVLGDFCLDVYWFVDSSRSEKSVETGLATHPVREQRYSLGGAGNVVSNLAALGCRHLHALGVVGDDPWGREQIRLLAALGVDTAGMLTQARDWSTLVYNKPCIERQESNRFDFGNFNRLADEMAEALLARCRALLPQVDVFIINEQVLAGVHSERLRQGLAALVRGAGAQPLFVSDCRHFSESYLGTGLKINEHEAARLCQLDLPEGAPLPRPQALQAAEDLYARFGQSVVLTRGGRGVVVRDAGGLTEVPAVQVLGRIDTVGAGDSMLSGLALALAAGCPPARAAQLGNYTAAVTIQKLNQTGTATPAEIRDVARGCNFIYRPELAADPRRARFHAGSELEIVTQLPAGSRLHSAIFDHDGTISTLREGWEQVMEPMMIKAILGPRYQAADEALYHKVVSRVREYIEQTTGIQTLVQMQGLVAIVREFGCVPAGEILDEFGYKAVYNEALMSMVRERVAKFERGELGVEDFEVKGAVAFLRGLRQAGVTLFLASGTDEADVRAEAAALGYAELFNGGIYGAVGDVTKEAKRMVLERILRQVGGAAGLATFGDGPVEIRETCRRGGYAVGIASDEVRRYGWNLAKRTRLIRAGADLVIPDWSQGAQLLKLLTARP